MVSNITFPANSRRGELVMTRVSSVKVESSFDLLTDWAEIQLPRNVKTFKTTPVGELIRTGDKVIIQLGYNTTLQEEFRGWVVEVGSDAPVVIRCEDNMYKLKGITRTISVEDAKLKSLLEAIIPKEFQINAMDVVIGTYMKKKSPVSMILKDLKEKFGLVAYFKGDTLVVGKIYSDDIEPGKRVKYIFEQNVKKNDLKFRKAEDRRIKVHAKSVNLDGESKTVSVGDEDGEVRELAYFNIESEEELTKLAGEDLKKFKVDGFDGDFKTFGIPFVQHGYIAELVSRQFPERNGKYFVKKVITEFDASPKYERTVVLGQKIN